MLLQDTPGDLENDSITDFVDVMSIFCPQMESLNSKDFCLLCGSSPSKEEALFCRDCGDCFHTYCAIDTRSRRIPKEQRHVWRCPACRICEVCDGEENGESMLCCEGCDRGFHTYCLKPAMKKMPNERWICNDCVHCVSCGAKHSSTRKEMWKKDYTLCVTCFQLYEKKADCPICKVVWQKEENGAKAVWCDTCNKWVHPACGGVDDAKYTAMQKEDEPGEWNCPKCTGDLDVSDEEENDKKYSVCSQTRLIEAHKEFEDFCHDRLKRLQRTCGAIKHIYQSHGEMGNALGGVHMDVLAANITCAHIDVEDPLAAKFEALKSFGMEHGHVHVAHDDGDLVEFVKQLRFYNEEGKLSEARLDFLHVLGFCYDAHRAAHLRAHIEQECARASTRATSAMHTSAHSHLTSDNPPKVAAPSGLDSVANQSASEAGHNIATLHDTMATYQNASSQAGDGKHPSKTEYMRSNAASAQGSIDCQLEAACAVAPPSLDAAGHLAAKQDASIMDSHSAIPAESQPGKRDDGAKGAKEMRNESLKEMRNESLEIFDQMQESNKWTGAEDVAASHQNLVADELSISTVEPHAHSATDEVMAEASAPGNLALSGGAGHLLNAQLYESKGGMQSEEDRGLAGTKEAAAVKREEAKVKASADASTTGMIQACVFEEAARKMSAKERAEKLSGLASLKKNLVKLDKAINKHKYKDCVPFFDDVVRMIHDPDLLSAIPNEVRRMHAQALEDMPDAAERSLITGQRVREPQIVSSEWHLSKRSQSAFMLRNVANAGIRARKHAATALTSATPTCSSASVFQQMMPHMDTFELGHDLHANQHKTGRVAAPHTKKYMVPENWAPGARGGFSTGAVGGAEQRVALHGSQILILMSQFYAKIDPFVRLNPETHGKLCKHFSESDWRALKLEQLTHFVEDTFRETPFIVQCFYDVFRDHLGHRDEEMVEEVLPVAARPLKELKDAEWFCSEVRRIYGLASPTYRDFLQIIKHYAHSDKDALRTIRAIKQLFSDNPTLIVEFEHFVPGPFKYYCTVDTPKTTVGNTRTAGTTNWAHILTASLASSFLSPASTAGQAAPWSGGAQPHQPPGRTDPGASPCNFDCPLPEQQVKQQQQAQQHTDELQKLYAKLQQEQKTGPEAEKRKVTDGAGIAANEPAHGHSLAAMCHQNQQQTQQQLLQLKVCITTCWRKVI